MSPTTIAHTTTLVVTSCWCGINLAIPSSLERAARDNQTNVYCPLGHTFVYGKNEKERLEAQLEAERRRAGRLAAERDQARQETITQKGRATRFRNDRDRLKTRAAAGVCPCCNRTFQQLARHMAKQHPGFADEAPEAGA